MKGKLGEDIIEQLRSENAELRKQLRNRNMTKDETIELIKKIVGKRDFINGVYKFNGFELDDFLEWLELKGKWQEYIIVKSVTDIRTFGT